MSSKIYHDERLARPVGQVEAFSTSRHSSGFYRGVAQTARYHVPASALQNASLESVIEQAVAQAILAHPILQVGIKDEDTNAPYFVYLPALDLSQIVRWQPVNATSGRDETLERILGERHSALWPDIAHRPGYEVIVLSPKRTSSTIPADGPTTLDIVFSWHHALGDGTSGAIFQRTLLDALNNPSPVPALSRSTHTLTLTRSPLAPPQESLLKFPISWTFMLKTLWAELAPRFLRPAPEPVWAGAPVTPDHNTTHIRLITFPASTLSSLLARVRARSATLTPLLHILILHSLSNRVPESPGGSGFSSTTPISLRRLLPRDGSDRVVDPDTTMGVIVCGQTHTFPASTAAGLRADPADESQVWALAAVLGAEMRAKVASLPGDDVVGLLGWVTDYHRRYLDKVGKARDTTWEVSNVGAVDMPRGGAGGWTVERMVFSQSGSVAGPALGVNVLAVRGGELAVTVTWQEGIVEEEVVDGLVGDLERWLGGLASTGRFGLP